MAEYKRICNFCYKSFIAHKYNSRTCSNRCAGLSYKMKVKQDKENMFNDKETYKRLLTQILVSIERIEVALELYGLKQQISKEELITPDKYCELMNIHRKTLSRMIQRNEILVIKQGNKILINKSQLNKK